MYGRHFDLEDELVSHISRKSIDLLKANYRVSLLPFFFTGNLSQPWCGEWFYMVGCMREITQTFLRSNELLLLFWPINLIMFYRMICPRMNGDLWWNWRIFSRYNEMQHHQLERSVTFWTAGSDQVS